MKSTGVVRRIDSLGRLVLPVEIRKNMGVANGDSVEIFTEDDKVILKKYRPSCVFCDNVDEVELFRGNLVCRKCIAELTELAK